MFEIFSRHQRVRQYLNINLISSRKFLAVIKRLDRKCYKWYQQVARPTFGEEIVYRKRKRRYAKLYIL